MHGLANLGKELLVPFGNHHRYDLAFEEDGKLVKVQCKTGHARKGVITFLTCSRGRGPERDYRGDVDLFGVYCPERDEVYLVPVLDVPLRIATLRTEPARNNQRSGIRSAEKYLISQRTPRLVD